jgi:hypothetical protein
MTGLSELSDSDLRTVADQAYLDTLQAATMAPQSEWHSECFCALHALCVEMTYRGMEMEHKGVMQ